METIIQPALPEDVPRVYELMLETISLLSRKDFLAGDDREYFERHIEQDGFILLARDDDEVQGFLMVDFPGDDERNLGRDLGWQPEMLCQSAHLDCVCVRPVFRGRGLQKRLIGAAEKILVQRGFRRFLATVHPENIASLSSMVSCGYQIGATKPKYGGLPRHILFKL